MIIISIAFAVLILTVSAENVAPEARVTHSYDLLAGQVTGGGGWIVPNPGEKVHFGFGNRLLFDHATGMKVNRESIDSLIVSEDNTGASFTGTARVNGISGYGFTAYAAENPKFFSLTITDPEGAEYYSTNGAVGGGNIKIGPSGDMPTTNMPIEFDASESYDSDGYIEVYRWDFGDGAPIHEGNIVTITHSYSVRGDYEVALTVTDVHPPIPRTIPEEEEGEEERVISNNVTWNGNHTFDGLDNIMFIVQFQTITATAYGIINISDSTVNVTVELLIDGMNMNLTNVTLGPGEQNISVSTMWLPISSGGHFVSLHVREFVDDEEESRTGEDYWIGPTNDQTAEVRTLIESIK